jgi:isopenicillin N synthase-like dioxygenase
MNGEGEWIDASPVQGGLVINIGDMLEVWSNGRFTATSHRVRKVKEERYSFPLFYSCDYWTVVEPLAPFVTPDSPRAYEAVTAGEHLHAQTVQTFTYLKARLARGEVALPENSRSLSSYGQEAKRKAS